MRKERLQITDLDTGVVVTEKYRLNGRLHRDPKEGPALVERDASNSHRTIEQYRWHGHLHRDPKEGPALTGWEKETGEIYWQEYRFS